MRYRAHYAFDIMCPGESDGKSIQESTGAVP